MSKKGYIKSILILGIASGLLIIGIFILRFTKPVALLNVDSNIVFSQRSINEIKEIKVSNGHGDYEIHTDSGGFIVDDLPAENINVDYLKMLLEESSVIVFSDKAESNHSSLAGFGLENPSSTVNIVYTDNTSISLLIGNEEPISKKRYAQVNGDSRIFLISPSKTVRFLSPVEVFIDFMIVPFPQAPSPFSAIGNISFSGSSLEEPLEITAVLTPKDAKEALSFGPATHLLRSPIFSEVDQGHSLELFTTFAGMINNGILTYNATDQELSDYGFNTPFLEANYQYKQTNDSPYTNIRLRFVKSDSGYLVVRDDQRIIHKLENKDVLANIDPKQMSLRWFLTPLITDIASVNVSFSEAEYDFVLSGNTNKDLSVKLNGNAIDSQAFRNYFVLLISAQRDDQLVDESMLSQKQVLSSIVFHYKDPEKSPDTMVLYKGPVRRIIVEVNGKSYFTMNENYFKILNEASEAIESGTEFDQLWQ